MTSIVIKNTCLVQDWLQYCTNLSSIDNKDVAIHSKQSNDDEKQWNIPPINDSMAWRSDLTHTGMNLLNDSHQHSPYSTVRSISLYPATNKANKSFHHQKYLLMVKAADRSCKWPALVMAAFQIPESSNTTWHHHNHDNITINPDIIHTKGRYRIQGGPYAQVSVKSHHV